MRSSVTLLILNGYLAVLACYAFFIFGYYLVKNHREGYAQMRPAIALTILWLGEMILRLPLFWTRAHIEAGYTIPPPTTSLIVGGIVTVTALLCIIRVFAPTGWGNKSWVSALIVSTVVVGLTLNGILGD